MKRVVIIWTIFALLVSSANAHEYWLEPDSFFLAPKQSSVVNLYLGEGLKVEEPIPYRSSKTSIFRLISNEGTFDLTRDTQEDAVPLFSFSAQKRGTYLLAMERNWSYITLEAAKFQEYLREDGLEYIIDEREKLGESSKQGEERYSRFLKSLIQVGDKRTPTFANRPGLRLDIIPSANPYSLKIGDELTVLVIFEGKPLIGRTIFADNREDGSIAKQRTTTNKDGLAKFKLDRKGVWLVRLVYMQRCAKNCEGADWESFWGALSFGVR
ncbi:MAG: DUF4198 domain-containing protein [Pyrinomonadaceae bacterium]